MSWSSWFSSEAWNISLRSQLLKAPRHVPSQVLSWLVPEGPNPYIFKIPSRGQYEITLYMFIAKDLTEEQAKSLPVVLDFHGGGFYFGSCLEQATFCAKMARELRAVVLSVDYRLAPTYKFPAGLEDAEDTLQAVLEPETRGGVALRQAVRKLIEDNWNEAGKTRQKGQDTDAKRASRSGNKAAKSDEPPSSTSQLPPEPSSSAMLKPPKSSSRASSRTSSRKSSLDTKRSPLIINLDPTRMAISGFSSGGNIALNLALSLDEATSGEVWPSVFLTSYQHPIPLLLYYPSFDSRQLPSERTLPKDLPRSKGFWAETADLLAPTYLTRDQTSHHRASPGLAPITSLHPMARMQLVLPGLDSLAEQSEMWVKKVKESGRAGHLRLERFPAMRHGWTQMPDLTLNENEVKQKNDVFDKTVEFTRRIWARDDAVLEGELLQGTTMMIS